MASIEKKLFVEDLQNSEGLAGESLFVLSRREERTTRNGKPFWDIGLRDRSGEVSGKVWADNLENVQDVRVNDVVYVDFEVRSYQGRVELVVRKMRGESEYLADDFIPVVEGIDLKELEKELRRRIDSIRDLNLRSLVDAFFDDNDIYRQFIMSPAAERVHHNYQHGLLQHSLEVLTILDSTFKIYPELNRDLVTTGALLHDVGKIYEYEIDSLGNLSRTARGSLVGHITIGVEMILKRMSDDFPTSQKTRLLHIILSHQGKLEWGSPIVPSTREALAVHHADWTSTYMNIAAKSMQEKKSTSSTGEQADLFSSYNRYLETSLYLGEGD